MPCHLSHTYSDPIFVLLLSFFFFVGWVCGFGATKYSVEPKSNSIAQMPSIFLPLPPLDGWPSPCHCLHSTLAGRQLSLSLSLLLLSAPSIHHKPDFPLHDDAQNLFLMPSTSFTRSFLLRVSFDVLYFCTRAAAAFLPLP